jgi:hypothetical protein
MCDTHMVLVTLVCKLVLPLHTHTHKHTHTHTHTHTPPDSPALCVTVGASNITSLDCEARDMAGQGVRKKEFIKPCSLGELNWLSKTPLTCLQLSTCVWMYALCVTAACRQ